MRYRVIVPIGKAEPGPGYQVGDIISDGDLPAESIDFFIGVSFLTPITEKKKTAVKKATKKDEVKDNG